MRLAIAALGRIRPGPERTLIDDYLARARASGRAIGFTGVEEIEVEPRKAKRGDATAALLAAVSPGATLVALDERGDALTSSAFARRLAAWRDDGRPAAAFLIGEADGLGEEARARADLVVSFGAWTWPHRLARVMIAEQLYRAVSILSGAPYHRE